MGIRGRLLALTLGVALPLALAGAVALWGLWTASRRQLEGSLRQRAEMAATSLEQWVDAQQKQLITVARYATAERRSAQMTETLRITATSLTWVDVRVVKLDGDTEFAEPVDAEPPQPELIAELFDDVRRRRTWAVAADLRTGEVTQPSLALGTPLEADRVAIARLGRESVKNFFRGLEPPEGGVFAVFDVRGRTVYHSKVTQKNANAAAQNGAPFVAALSDQPTAVIETISPLDGMRRVYGLARVGATNFIVVVGAPSAIVGAPARRQLIGYILLSLLALSCAVAAALIIARSIDGPLRRLRSAVRAFGEGDVTARAPVRGVSEIAELGTAFNVMAAQTQAREARLSELDRLKSEFIGNVSHELRTPLTTIKTMSHVLLQRESASNAERREYLATIAAECDREISLVTKLIDLSKIETGAFNLTIERIDVADTINACLMSSRASANARGQELSAVLPENMPFAQADYTALRRVVCELIDSAVRYTPDGGRITVAARGEAQEVIISVTDTGRGISAEDAPHIFEKFFRGRFAAELNEPEEQASGNNPPDHKYREVSGMGVGLYVIRRLVELMQGSIDVESEPGRGSTFTVRLPAWPDKNEENEAGERGGSVV